MKQIIFSSIVLSFLFFFINNEKGLAQERKKNLPPEKPIDYIKLLADAKPDDPRMQPQNYCDSMCIPTLYPPATFDAKKDAQDLYSKVSGMANPRENGLIEIITRRGVVQRIQIASAYATMLSTEKDLHSDIITNLGKEIDGAFKRSILALLKPLPVLFAEAIHEAVVLRDTHVVALVENICSVSNFGVQSITDYYNIMYTTPLEEVITNNTSGSFQRVLLSIVQLKRREGPIVDMAQAVADAQTLHGSGSKPWHFKPMFSDILGTSSNAHLKQVFIEYQKISGQEIENDFAKEFPGAEGHGLFAFVRLIKSKAQFFAERLNNVINFKRGPDFDGPLIRIFVSRSEMDLGAINAEYEKMYQKNLHAAIVNKIGGSYRRVITNMAVGNRPPVAAPRAGSPPVEAPPARSPPVEASLAGSPPVEAPPAGSPPVEAPPAGSPPVLGLPAPAIGLPAPAVGLPPPAVGLPLSAELQPPPLPPPPPPLK